MVSPEDIERIKNSNNITDQERHDLVNKWIDAMAKQIKNKN